MECAGQTLPVAPTSLPVILARAAEYAKSDTLSFLAASFGRLPAAGVCRTGRTILARHRDKVVLYDLLERLCKEEPRCLGGDRSVGGGAEWKSGCAG